MYIFINYAVPREYVEGNCAVSVPANRQTLLYTEILKEASGNLKCITIPPRKSRFALSKNESLLKGKDIIDGVDTHEICFRDMPIVKQCGIAWGVYRTLKKLVKEATEPVIVITFNSNSWISVPLMWLKKRFHYKTAIILADMPFDENATRSITKRLFRGIENHIRVHSLESYDACITGVDYMINKYFAKKISTRIDPAIETEEYDFAINEYKKENISHNTIDILYTGSLNTNYNITNLIEVAHRLPEGYRVIFYGRGEFLKQIQDEEKSSNGKILYGGYLDAKSIKDKQVRADILISLLDTNKNISKYAVPSKTYDYMCTGVPIVSSNADSLPNEVKEFLYITDDHSVDNIVGTILEITKDESSRNLAKEKASAAREYVLENCNWDIQRKRIISCIKALEGASDKAL